MSATYPVSYTTVSLMVLTFPEVGSKSTMVASVLEYHAYVAESYVNASISMQYAVPLSARVPVIESITTDLALHSALSTFVVFKKDDSEHPFYQRFKRSMDSLKDIANGKLTLVDIDGTVIAGRNDIAEVYSNNMNYHPTFSELPESLSNIDPDKVDDLLEERDNDLRDILI